MKSYLNRAIIHIDGDAFFASVEQVKDYRLKGKPVVTGGERYIAASMSYEAKDRGVTRGMKLHDIRKVCPDVVILQSDYVTYTIFARRMYNIVRAYTDIVEEYSIDECFADITGLDEKLGMSYEEIGQKIKEELERKLGLTFGVGLGATKVLAKCASKHKKPAGFTYIPHDHVDSEARARFLEHTPVERVWGIGTSTTKLLRGNGILTALDFARMTSHQLAALRISKPYRQIHMELNGMSVLPVQATPREMAKSVMCSRTFTPSSKEREYIFSHLSKNIEEACEHLRYQKGLASACSFFLKSQDFRYFGMEFKLDVPTDDPSVFTQLARAHFDRMYKTHITYRSSGLSLRQLIPVDMARSSGGHVQGLFDALEGSADDASAEHAKKRASTDLPMREVDMINRRYGQHSIGLASSLRAVKLEDKRHRQVGRPKRIWAIPLVGIAT